MRFGMMGMVTMLAAATAGMAHGERDSGKSENHGLSPIIAPNIAIVPTRTSKSNAVEGSIGVCWPVLNKGSIDPIEDERGQYALSVVYHAAGLYAHDPGKDPSVGLDYETSEITVLEQPTHGKLGHVPNRDLAYYPDSTYAGNDKAVFLAKQGDHQIKVVYFFKVVRGTDNLAFNRAYEKYCSPPGWWKISSSFTSP